MNVTKHRLKQKKLDKGKQWSATDLLMDHWAVSAYHILPERVSLWWLGIVVWDWSTERFQRVVRFDAHPHLHDFVPYLVPLV